MAIALPDFDDHIHMVVGMKSSLVAINVPSLLNAMMEIPCVRLLAFVSEADSGGLAANSSGP